MPHLNRALIQRLTLSFLLALTLSACNGDIASPEDSLGNSEKAYSTQIFVSFADGPNAGRHQYILDDSKESKVELKYNKQSDVTFLELQGLVSLDGSLRIDEVRRFTKGVLSQGVNSASTWRGEVSDENTECGAINLRDSENTQSYQNAFGVFSQCGDTVIESVGEWKPADDSPTLRRTTKGQFSDRIKFEMSMDNAPFQRFETEVTVEFDLLEIAAKF